MAEYKSFSDLLATVLSENASSEASPTRIKDLNRASQWAKKAYRSEFDASEPSLEGVATLHQDLICLYESGKISKSTFSGRRHLVADLMDLMEFGAIGRTANLTPWRKGDNPLARPVPDDVRNDSESIVGLSFAVLDAMAASGHSANTIRFYKMCALPRLIEHFKDLGTDRYSEEALNSFISKVGGGFCSSSAFYSLLRPAALHVRSLHNTECLHQRRSTLIEDAEFGPFGEIISGFTQWRRSTGIKEKTLKNDVGTIVPFFKIVYTAIPNGLEHITRDTLKSSIARMSEGRSPRYVCRMLTSIRALARFVEVAHPEIPDFGVWLGRNPRVVRGLPIEGYTEKQANAMINATDAQTTIGLRDKAIMLLMKTTGMRACDVVALKLDDIDWHSNEIDITQEKTGVAVALPLDIQAGEAIATYVLEVRRNCKEKTVFTTVVGVARPLLANSICCTILRYSSAADDAGFKGAHGPHAFRRGLGTAMVDAGASLADVADVLGHSHAESALPYVSIASERLRCCCASLSEIPSANEEVSSDGNR